MNQKSDKQQLFKREIQNLLTADYRIIYDTQSDTLKIVDKKGEEIDNNTLGFVGGEVNEYINIREEQTLGEKRKYPIDELTRKRQELLDYILVSDESNNTYKTIFEVYHDKNQIFSMEKFNVMKRKNLRCDEFNVYLSPEEAETILPSLQKFIEQNKKSDSE
ncbi:hypothetical protein [Paenibacillus sp. ISL-20]|uniref:hypothetical protein n=1 Tax=Paenibacillus sp. ISL-20 TaxID=2819163 RepID=UPI001BE87C58|nr:hypothetical protein [Paenibacillus sp. ISL-20]MBT2759948.1 hypothetical protein [Paenibacillus sp. ISL-20]